MSLLTNQTSINGTAFYFSSGGGGGSGSNIIASTITLEGSAAPITATLPSGSNDGFEVRQGGGGNNNVVIVGTIDAASSGQIEFGARVLSTTNVYARYEMDLTPSANLASLNYQQNGSTIGFVNFDGANNLTTIGSLPASSGGAGNSITFSGAASTIVVKPSGHDLVPKKILASNTNFYLPPSGSSNIAQFSTIAGHVYSLGIPFFVTAVEPVAAPTGGSFLSLDIDTSPGISYLDTYDLAQVSTVGNDMRTCRQYCFVASANGHTLSATALNPTLSTLVEIPVGMWLQDLGASNAIPSAY